MKKSGYIVFVLSILLSCQPVPITGRSQLHLIPQSQMLALSFESYEEFLSNHPIIKEGANAEMVKRVGRNIQGAVERFFQDHRMSDRLKDYKWEYNLIQDSLVNAWAMPGGKVGVYTGILPVTKNDTGLAVVLGHEIAHAIANHGDERMSQALLVQLGGVALAQALAKKPELTRQLAFGAFGLGSEVGILLPHSRLQESEADQLGLIFMAMAGYDPHAAVGFWERMSKRGSGAPPEFLSTHPSDKRRIEDIRKKIPEAMKYYKK
jgi:predicted Zn-dependent protease